jgi:hypothetical protein
MDTKHTPGPWKAVELIGPLYIVRKDDQSELQRCTIAGAVRLADARLIAAAPELLDALKGMVNLAEKMNDSSNEGGMLDDRFDAAMAAIATATGSNE